MFEYVKQTLRYSLDPWQIDLCRRLAKAAKVPGSRLIIHAPPQWGKTVITGQRFPVWALGSNPSMRVRIATYSEGRAIASARAVRTLVKDDVFSQMFGVKHDGIPAVLRWSTQARLDLNDGQPSFQALGLGTGFVGTGADLLIVDDPYASDKDAYSPAIRNQVWSWWTNTVEARLTDETSIVIMYHRWHDDDLAGTLLREQPEQWDYIRYSAEYDGEGTDPIGRTEEGAILSPRFSHDFLAKKKKNMGEASYRALYQGLPLPLGGGLLNRSWFQVISREEFERRLTTNITADLEKIVASAMGVDLAVTAKNSADWTVAIPGVLTDANRVYMMKPYRAQSEWPTSRREILARAQRAKIRVIGVDAGGQQMGMIQNLRESEGLGVCSVIGLKPVRDKEVRAREWAPIAEQGRVFLVDDGSGWVDKFLEEASVFPQGRNDDQVDAVSNLFDVMRVSIDPTVPKIEVYPR